MGLNETCSKVCIGRHSSDVFHTQNCLKQGDTLLPLLLNFALEYTTEKVTENWDRLEMNQALQLLVYIDSVKT
jgi:hypothetical protein